MNRHRSAAARALLPALLLLAGCSEDGGPVAAGPGPDLEIEGAFAAAAAPAGPVGALALIDAGAGEANLLDAGAVVFLELHPSGALRGRVSVPDNPFGVPARTARVAGTWTADGDAVRLVTVDPALSGARLEPEGDVLAGRISLGGLPARLVLDRIDPVPSISAEELAAARERWDANGSDDYDMTIVRGCFCGPSGPFVVEVRGGEIVSVRFADSGEPIDPALAGVATVDGLFDFLAEELARPSDRVLATFDPSLGFPVSVDVDLDFMVSDDELSFRIRELVLNP